MDKIETARGREAVAKQALDAAAKALRAKREGYKQDAERLVAQAKELVAQRNRAARGIDAGLMRRYEALRAAKGGLAIVAIEDDFACGGCKMALPSVCAVQIRESNEIQLCDNCGRIICEPTSDPT
jgi:predicted  nucleic acid-binding Zn-ribbon protein